MWPARAIALVVGAVLAMACSTPPEPDEAPGWTSVAWRVAEAAFAPDRPTTVTEVEWFGPGAIVIGDGPNPNPNPDGLVTTATGWRSADLDAWEGWTIADGLRVDDVAAIADVAAGPLGALAIGGTCSRTEEASAWWSSDGRDWRRAHVPIDDHAAVSFLAVAAGPDGFVIAGIADGGAAIWASADGRDWRLLTPDGAPVRQGAATGVARVGDRWVGVGFEDKGIDANGVVWLGRTLDDWARVADRDPALKGRRRGGP